jgi:RNase P protein component
LAVRRNRLKRLVREAVRGVAYFEAGSKQFHFHVRAMPQELTLAAVRKAVEKAIET